MLLDEVRWDFIPVENKKVIHGNIHRVIHRIGHP
jgi:hypothetical protein